MNNVMKSILSSFLLIFAVVVGCLLGGSTASAAGTAKAAEATSPAVTADAATSFPQAKDCPVCAQKMKESKGCQTGYNSPDYQRIYDKENKDTKTAPSKTNGTEQ